MGNKSIPKFCKLNLISLCHGAGKFRFFHSINSQSKTLNCSALLNYCRPMLKPMINYTYLFFTIKKCAILRLARSKQKFHSLLERQTSLQMDKSTTTSIIYHPKSLSCGRAIASATYSGFRINLYQIKNQRLHYDTTFRCNSSV